MLRTSMHFAEDCLPGINAITVCTICGRSQEHTQRITTSSLRRNTAHKADMLFNHNPMHISPCKSHEITSAIRSSVSFCFDFIDTFYCDPKIHSGYISLEAN